MTASFTERRRKPRVGTLLAILLLHVAILYGLARAFAPGAVASVERSVVSAFTVTVETKETPPEPVPDPEVEPEPDAGASGEEAPRAVPREVSAPLPPIPLPSRAPAPRASSTGSADTSGAGEQGSGTGAGGEGTGPGGGGSGSGQGGGQGGGIATEPVLVSGRISDSRDYPTPPGGRAARRGTQVIVRVIVGTDGRATNCTIYRPSPDPEADRITCRLVVERLRFRPATDTAGNPVPAPFYWRQRWF